MATTKLLPPYIEGKLPAQVGDVLRIPYSHNLAVGSGTTDEAVLKIKTVATSLDVAELVGVLDKDGFAIFHLGDVQLRVGTFYKAQLAYKNNDVVGYFSTVGVFKYTEMPKVYISANDKIFEENIKNYFSYYIIGNYESNINDPNEKVYTYRFDIYEDGKIFETTGDLLHNSTEDTSTQESYDSFTLLKELSPTRSYRIQYVVNTTNGLEVKSPQYYIANQEVTSINLDAELIASSDIDYGCINIEIAFPETKNIEGQFVLLRYNSLDNFSSQEILQNFIIDDITDKGTRYSLYKDYTVQQGIIYKYALQQYYGTIFSEKLFSNTVRGELEDIFLSDGERQLKVRFNPKVSSLKKNILESKVDTIGGKHPFITRNGNTEYFEFSVQGLISYHMDNEEIFMNHKELGIYSQNLNRTSTKSGFNAEEYLDEYSAERVFKLAVLEWLTNGKPKLFRSATEGNYIIRLMNITFSPEDTLGRMIHNFSANAYEIKEYTYQNLKECGFVGKIENRIKTLHYYKLDLSEKLNGATPRFEFAPAAQARLIDVPPYSSYKLGFSTGEEIEITVGSTGYYEVNTRLGLLTSILPLSLDPVGYLEFTMQGYSNYYLISNFNGEDRIITEITGKEYGGQFYGPSVNIINDMLDVASGTTKVLNNILYLSLRAKNIDNSNLNTSIPDSTGVDFTYTITYKDGTSSVGDLSENIINENSTIWGRIDFTSLDFNNNFVPVSIRLGSGLYADVYYVVNTVFTDAVPKPYSVKEAK